MTEILGQLTFFVTLPIENAEPRLVQYTRSGARYLPERLSFKVSAASHEEALPVPGDLRTGAVIIAGSKLKKDGTPGAAEHSEQFYFASEYPDWAVVMIDEVLGRLRKLTL